MIRITMPIVLGRERIEIVGWVDGTRCELASDSVKAIWECMERRDRERSYRSANDAERVEWIDRKTRLAVIHCEQWMLENCTANLDWDPTDESTRNGVPRRL